ncbi:MAG: leucyl/phenylalanyl-tRNA--protein transferase, partial [Burkholderiaceae bacterium]
MSESPEHRLAWIGPDDDFPASDLAWTEEMGANGLLGAGDQLTADLLKRAYARGIFPWSGPSEPILWWSPSPRMVLQTKDFKQRRSLTQAIRQAQAEGFLIKSDTAFNSV